MAGNNELTVNSVLERTIGALAANDAQQLASLLDDASRVEAPRREQQGQTMISNRSLLAALLNGTERNLRLLRRNRSSVRMETYGRMQF